MKILIVFFFTSRRRHTRWPRDWSSDVCSSDLVLVRLYVSPGRSKAVEHPGTGDLTGERRWIGLGCSLARVHARCHDDVVARRSEERRVGRECIARGQPVALIETAKQCCGWRSK